MLEVGGEAGNAQSHYTSCGSTFINVAGTASEPQLTTELVDTGMIKCVH